MKEKAILNPTNDYVFKRIFGRKNNEDITRGFIEAVTGVRYEEINLEDTPILERDLLENKMGILDVKVIANKYNDIDIEMQVVKSEHIADRILWYWSKMYSASIERGKGYSSTKRAICILIADFSLENLKNIPNYHTIWNIRESKYSNIILTEKLEIHIIELEKLENMKDLTVENKKLLNWCKFIKSPDSVEASIMKENEEIKKAKEELDKISQDAKERRLAELREKALMDEMAIRDSGYNEGHDDGKKEGKIEGRIETQIEITKNMLNGKFTVEQISELTGLSVDEIKKLKE
ncbi:MAG: Rpn family recombination-promoting nuclease/putative transposase [Clostridia bacterium]|nr:Rpn family recombination-promoting nuclease/putative transposase [Clostridia bacterium]